MVDFAGALALSHVHWHAVVDEPGGIGVPEIMKR